MGALDERARARVKEWLGGSGLTQTALADRIGRNQAWMSRYLDGGFDTDLETLDKIARAFEHTLFELLDARESHAEGQLLHAYRALRPASRKLLLRLAEEWADVSTPRTRTRGSRDE